MPKILVIEDEPVLRDAYRMALCARNFSVETAYDGKNGLQKLKEFKPDLILLDILMPNMNGIEFLEEAQLSKKYKNVKVIVFSNLSDDETIRKVLMLGAHKTVLKSNMSPKDLINMVEQMLKPVQRGK